MSRAAQIEQMTNGQGFVAAMFDLMHAMP